MAKDDDLRGQEAEVQIPEEDPTQQQIVPFMGDDLAAAMTTSGQIYVTLPGICAALGLDITGQLRRFRRTRALNVGLRQIPLRTRGGFQKINCLSIDKVALWLAGIQTAQVSQEFKEKIERYQDELAPVATRVFMQVMGITTPAPTDPRLAVLAEQYETLLDVASFIREHMESLATAPTFALVTWHAACKKGARQCLSVERRAKRMRQETVRDVGATWLGEGRCRFRVWATEAEFLAIHLLAPHERIVPLERESGGYFAAEIADVAPGTRYFIRFADGHERPDPASRYQPEGVHGPSAVVAPFDGWTDADWRGTVLAEYVIYEIHVGTFTPEGTFDAIIPRLDDLIDLGITAIEIMPIAQFPGSRNWGYDGVDPFAVQNSYGGPAGFARLVDACHACGLAVILDVVYNHLGPEGNYLRDFGPYFTAKYRTPWGDAINFDDAESDAVRGYFIQNALQWVQDFHVDALRLDAAHAITDTSAHPFLAELAEHVHAAGERLGRHVYLIAESDLNDPRLVDLPERNGMGLDAQWSDDLHHALHTLLTGEQDGYYADFGEIDHLVRALRDGYAYAGDYSTVRRRSHGAPARNIPAWRFVVGSQNHDQIGNRMLGERLSQLVAPDALRLAAGVILLSPYLPLIFMGEEYGAQQPFLFFTSHGDPNLIKAVREGRRAEFAAFAWQGEAPDPQAEAAFAQSRPDPVSATAPWQIGLRALYQELLRLRSNEPALAHLSKDEQVVQGFPAWQIVTQRRWHLTDEIFAIYHFGANPQTVPLPVPPGTWRVLLDSDDPRWGGPASEEGRDESHPYNDRGQDDRMARPPGAVSPRLEKDAHKGLHAGDAPDHNNLSSSSDETDIILESSGALDLTLAPRSFLVLARRAERID